MLTKTKKETEKCPKHLVTWASLLTLERAILVDLWGQKPEICGLWNEGAAEETSSELGSSPRSSAVSGRREKEKWGDSGAVDGV